MVTDRPCYSVSSNRALLAEAVTWCRMISMCCLAVILVIDGNSTVMLCVLYRLLTRILTLNQFTVG